MDFLAGTLFGIFLGIAVAPLLTSYLAWREVRDAREDADLARRIIAHMERITRTPHD